MTMRRVDAVILFFYILGLVLFIAIRTYAVPPSFGEIGWYRADAIEEIANQSIKFSDSKICFSCHYEEYTIWELNEHRNVSCQSCHGALSEHVKNPKSKAEGDYFSLKYYGTDRDFCLSCHQKDLSKPKNFPQVSVSEHEKVLSRCMNCHDPHNSI